MAELKPCRFCGSEKVGEARGNCYWVDEEYQNNIRVIGCKKCGAISGIFNVRALGEEQAKEKAIESWNRRPNDVAEVVRCKDCNFCHYNSESGLYHCRRRGYFSEEVSGDDFCSYGIRKEDAYAKEKL